MPMPVSRSSQRIVVSRASLETSRTSIDTSPARVNLIALLPRLSNTWRRRLRIADDALGDRRVDMGDQFEPLRVRLDGEQMRNVVHHAAQVHVDLLQIELAGFDLGEVEDVVDDREQSRRRCRGSFRCDRAASGRDRFPAAARSCRSPRSWACGFRGSCWPGIATSPGRRARRGPLPAPVRHSPSRDPACAAPPARPASPPGAASAPHADGTRRRRRPRRRGCTAERTRRSDKSAA